SGRTTWTRRSPGGRTRRCRSGASSRSASASPPARRRGFTGTGWTSTARCCAASCAPAESPSAVRRSGSIENGPFVGQIAPPTDPRLAPAPPLHHGGDMARISYDETTAAGYKAVRELPREGLADWRDAVERHLRPTPGMTLVDIGAGTGQFSSALG